MRSADTERDSKDTGRGDRTTERRNTGPKNVVDSLDRAIAEKEETLKIKRKNWRINY